MILSNGGARIRMWSSNRTITITTGIDMLLLLLLLLLWMVHDFVHPHLGLARHFPVRPLGASHHQPTLHRFPVFARSGIAGPGPSRCRQVAGLLRHGGIIIIGGERGW